VIDVQGSWNKIARHYVRQYRISDKIIHYGPLCPGEDKLKLMGNLRGRKVLDLGCGAGQNTVALARQGAKVTAFDFSDAQIAQARKLAHQKHLKAEFIVGNISGRLPFPDLHFDLIISACAIAFVKDIDKAFREAFRLLKTGGKFILSDMHPLQYILDEESDKITFNHPFPHKPILLKWSWDFGAGEGFADDPLKARFQHYVRSLSAYHNALTGAGFVVEQMLEPKSTLNTPHIGFSREIWKEYKYIASHLPITFIMVCRKPHPKGP
jgi:ubiquinone/menaquinone biosynthesis C-methylase UbiE